MKKVAIMQPYLFPYIGYWQLLAAVDEFVLLDDVQYINRGWINRNRILVEGRDHLFSFSVKKDSQQKKINERFFAEDFSVDRTRFLRTLQCSYRKAPYFGPVFSLVERSLEFSAENLARNLGGNIALLSDYLQIKTPVRYASDIDCDKQLKAQAYILELTRRLQGNVYVNLSGGKQLYDQAVFRQNAIELLFIQTEQIEYQQFGQPFVPFLSIIDVMMFNSPVEIRAMLGRYQLV